ncbi:MAG: erythromycin esterase family protein [Gemmatimonadales bacterium]|nr:erythromycin esterase family protein [Gemmatimonadales bacterium]
MRRPSTIAARAALLFLIAPGAAAAQTSAPPPLDRSAAVRWLQDNSIPLRSFAPADTDYTDLAPLGAAIGGARVVMLGEQSHGDGTVFLTKTRIIKYLHEKLGFEVLAFESGLYDVKKAWEFLREGEAPFTAVRRGVFGIWAGSQQVQPLIDYLGIRAKSDRPLELAGFDSQITGRVATEFWVRDLVSFLGAHGIDTAQVPGWTDGRALLDSLVTPAGFSQGPPAEARQRLLLTVLDTVGARVAALPPADRETAFWKQNLRSIRAQAAFAFNLDLKRFRPSAGNPRDAQMAENLLWLARERYPDKKIIVWAATFHIMRSTETIGIPVYQGLRTMGDILGPVLGKEMYAIGFVASQGAVGSWMGPPRTLPAPPPESLEGMWASTTHALAMIDFRGQLSDAGWLRQPILAGPLGYSILPAAWPTVLDAMIYTRVMEPSTKATR